MGEDIFIGPYDSIFAADDTQHMWWYPALPDIQLTGTFWISDMENEEHRRDVFTEKTKPFKLKKNELIDRLHSSVVMETGRKANIVSKAKENDISVEENEHDKKEGWN